MRAPGWLVGVLEPLSLPARITFLVLAALAVVVAAWTFVLALRKGGAAAPAALMIAPIYVAATYAVVFGLDRLVKAAARRVRRY